MAKLTGVFFKLFILNMLHIHLQYKYLNIKLFIELINFRKHPRYLQTIFKQNMP